MVISLALMAVIMGAFVMALNNSSDSFLTGCAKTLAGSRIDAAMNALLADLREAPRAQVDVETRGLLDGQCAVAMPTAQDADGTFHLTADYRPEWQGVVVYCPYETGAGVRQLRRYVVYQAGLSLPVAFATGNPITSSAIRVSTGTAPITIDREAGNTELDVGREFLVYCPGLVGFTVETGSPTTVTLQATVTARGQAVVTEEGTTYVAHRN
jgi:hypothetical protein